MNTSKVSRISIVSRTPFFASEVSSKKVRLIIRKIWYNVTYMCASTHVCLYMCVYTCVFIHVCLYMCVYTCMFIHVCLYMCVGVRVVVHEILTCTVRNNASPLIIVTALD